MTVCGSEVSGRPCRGITGRPLGSPVVHPVRPLWIVSAFVGCALAAALLAAPAASAATEIGGPCKAGVLSASKQVVQTGRAGAAFKTAVPGVVTKWEVVTGNQGPVAETLKVYKPLGSDIETVGESAPGNVEKETKNVFATRIPVPAGVIFGGYSPTGIPYCFQGGLPAGDTIAFSNENIPIGTSKPSGTSQAESRLALTVTVEPDADGDGFGDETQDGCPTNPMVQGACPVISPPPTTGGGGSAGTGGGAATLSLSLKAKLEGNVVAVQVTGSDRAAASVSGLFRGRTVTGPQSASVGPGLPGRVYLPLSKSLKERLAALPRKRHLYLVIEAKGQSAAGASAATSTEVALPGRKKTTKHHRPAR